MKDKPTPAQRLYAKIPELKPGSGIAEMWLSKWQIKKLDDEEFTFLYYMPGQIIKVSNVTANYVEHRRRALRLVAPKTPPPVQT